MTPRARHREHHIDLPNDGSCLIIFSRSGKERQSPKMAPAQFPFTGKQGEAKSLTGAKKPEKARTGKPRSTAPGSVNQIQIRTSDEKPDRCQKLRFFSPEAVAKPEPPDTLISVGFYPLFDLSDTCLWESCPFIISKAYFTRWPPLARGER